MPFTGNKALDVRCPSEGCKAIVDHLDTCPNHIVLCRYNFGLGCTEMRKRKEIEGHEDDIWFHKKIAIRNYLKPESCTLLHRMYSQTFIYQQPLNRYSSN